jgi:hypothetical protein
MIANEHISSAIAPITIFRFISPPFSYTSQDEDFIYVPVVLLEIQRDLLTTFLVVSRQRNHFHG